MMPCDVYGCIFSWSTIRIKAFERKHAKAFILEEFLISDSYFENLLNGQSSNSRKHVIITFYLPHIFQYIPLKNVVNYFCFKKNRSLLSTKWVKLTPKTSHFFGPGTWTNVIDRINFRAEAKRLTDKTMQKK